MRLLLTLSLILIIRLNKSSVETLDLEEYVVLFRFKICCTFFADNFPYPKYLSNYHYQLSKLLLIIYQQKMYNNYINQQKLSAKNGQLLAWFF